MSRETPDKKENAASKVGTNREENNKAAENGKHRPAPAASSHPNGQSGKSPSDRAQEGNQKPANKTAPAAGNGKASSSNGELARRANQLSGFLEQGDLMAIASGEGRSQIESYLGYFRRLLEGMTGDQGAGEATQKTSNGKLDHQPQPETKEPASSQKNNLAQKKSTYPLSPMQQGMLFHSLHGENEGAYVLQLICRLNEAVHLSTLEAAWTQVVERHSVLRTSFRWNGVDEPVQQVHDSVPTVIENLDWRELDAQQQEERFQQFLLQDRKQAFDWEKAPLTRLTFIHLGEDASCFVWSTHHALVDRHAVVLVVRELFEIYDALVRGESIELPAPPAYQEYIEWLQQRDLNNAEIYWRKQLQGCAPLQPFAFRKPGKPSGAWKENNFIVPRELSRSLDAVIRDHGLTLNTVVQGAWALLLSSYTGQRDIVIGATRGCRAEMENARSIVGLFINTVPVRLRAEPSTSLVEFLRNLREQNIAVRPFENTPLHKIQGWAGLVPGTTLFDTIVAFNNNDLNYSIHENTGGKDSRQFSIIAPTNYPLVLSGYQRPEFSLRIAYDGSLFDDATVARMIGHICELLKEVAANPVQPLREVEILTAGEKEQVLREWNQTDAEYPQTCVHHLFETVAEKNGSAEAVECAGQVMSYGELNRRANQLARYLQRLGAGPEERVGICVDRSAEIVVAVLGVLKAGGAYVPLDPEYPADRLQYMAEDARVKLVVTSGGVWAGTIVEGDGKEAAADVETVRVLRLDEEWESIRQESEDNPARTSGPGNLAYVLYTSGSTGRPKGVEIEHRQLVNYLSGVVARLGLNRCNFAMVQPLAVDSSVTALYPPLITGGCVHVVSRELSLDAQRMRQFFEERKGRVAGLKIAPSHLLALQTAEGEAGNQIMPAEVLVVGGEGSRWEWLKKLKGQNPGCSIFNHYGPTETTVGVLVFQVGEEGAEKYDISPLGKPLANTQVYVLDENMNPAPVGVGGELYIGGEGLARGYRNRPDLTAEKFVPNPFSPDGGARLYRTGDRGRWLENGNIEFLGRFDDQVKIRGFRIELGEIEAVLVQHLGIAEAAVVVKGSREGEEKRLVGYVVWRKGITVSIAELREYLHSRLPEHMVPGVFVDLEELPRTAHGKLDRKGLPEPEKESCVRQGYEAPEGQTETTLAGIWAEVLKLERVGRQDHFFELGGHSLLAMQVISRVRQVLQVDVAMQELFARPVLADFARAVQSAVRSVLRPIERLKHGNRIPLSFAQQRLWFLAQMGVSRPYHMGFSLELHGELNVSALRRAMDRIIARHEALRTTFALVDGELVQRIAAAEESSFQLQRHDLRGHPDSGQLLAKLVEQEVSAPFDLEAGPLIRGRLIQTEEQQHAFLITMHHVVSDGWSNELLMQELSALYKAYVSGAQDDLPELQLQYADYAVWQRQWMEGEVLRQQAEYWKDALAGAPALLELPTDHVRPAQRDYAGASLELTLDEELTAGLEELSRARGTTLFMTLLGGWAALLGRLSGQQDVVIGTPTANRGRSEIEKLIGLFINTLAVRVDLSGKPTVSELLGRVKGQMLAGQEHQDIPFEQVVELVQPARSMAHSPLFQVLFAWQNSPEVKPELPGLEIHPLYTERVTSKFDLTLSLRPTGQKITGTLTYSTALFERTTAERYVGYLRTLLQGMIARVAEPVERLPLLSEQEQQQVLYKWNDTAVEYLKEECVHELFEAQVCRVPQAVAVGQGARELTYAELNGRANQLAHYLRGLGVKAETRVAICTERSVEMMIGILAVLKAGGAYVPMDPSYPPERLQVMLEDSSPLVLLTEDHLRSMLPSVSPETIVLDLANDAAWSDQPQTNLERSAIGLKPCHLVYVIYTSGSTGRPKGVMIEHRNLSNYLRWSDRSYYQQEACGSPALHSIGFDGGVTTLFGPLLAGQALRLVPRGLEIPYLTQLFSPDSVVHTLLKVTPSHLKLVNQLIPADASRAPAVTLMIGGEALIPSDVLFWQRRFPQVRLINHFGPTEITVACCTFEIKERVTETRSIPIGKPISNTHIYILDAHRQPVPIGVPGELYVGGAGVARGYLNRPELTAERFVQDPFSAAAGARMYKTGDLGRWLADGSIEFLGRNDDQVKIRGFRIELGEIETWLRQCAGVREAVVLAKGDKGGEKRLVAYYTCQKDECVPAEQLRSKLADALPGYMVPAAYVRMEALPLNAHGKVNRRALPEPEESAYAKQAYQPPVGETETALASIWAEVLKLDRVGRQDDFFELGGHSLLAVQVISRVRQVLQVEVAMQEVFARPVLADFALAIDNAARSVLRPIERAKRGNRIPLSFAQQRLWFLAQMGESRPYHMALNLKLQGVLDQAALRRALDRLIARHESLRTTFAFVDGEPVQRIAEVDGSSFQLRQYDLREQADADQQLAKFAEQEVSAPFDLEAGPLVRGRLIQIAEQQHALLITMHHIVSDGWSNELLMQELSALYKAYVSGEEGNLPELKLQYADYAVWQRQWMEGEVLRQQIEYWKGALAGAPALLELPTDHVRPAQRDYAGASLELTLDEELTAGLEELGRARGTTLFMTLLGCWAALLGRLSGQQDVVIGTPTANRGRSEIEKLIGLFINTLAVRVDLSGGPTVDELLRRVKGQMLAGQEHQDIPFEQVVELVQPVRSLAHSPLFQVMFTWQNSPEVRPELPGLEVQPLRSERITSKFDLTLSLRPTGQTITGTLTYSTALFERTTAERYIGYLRMLLQGMVTGVAEPVERLPLLSEQERRQVLYDSNNTAVEYPKEKCLHELFEEQVSRVPQAVAVAYGERELTYAELNGHANQLAHYLCGLGVKAETRVAICTERSPEMIVGLLAVLKAGGAYIPLDPAYPVERIRYMLEDSQASVVLTQEKFQEIFMHGPVQVVSFDREWSLIANNSGQNLEKRVQPHHLAYVIYTSGSTGQPKGVAIEHHSPVTLVHWASEVYSREELAGVLAPTSICFDLSVYEIFVTLANGGKIILVPNALGLINLSNKESVTLINTVPSAIEELVRLGAIPSSVQTINLAGEPLSPVLVDKIYENSSVNKVYDLYGPSEDTTYSTFKLRENNAPQTIGRPIANTQVYILDQHNQPQPIGVPGELHISGDGLSRGYLNRPELTQAKFVVNPFLPGTRMYKTGDLARWLEDGNIQYLGRIDTQVKIRGFRIELGEIEAQLNRHPHIEDSVVIVQGQEAGKQLIAFYRAKESTADHLEEVPADELRAHISQTLPEYMVPAGFVSLAAIPLNANGKVDRKALARLEVTIGTGQEYVAPRNERERELVEIWAQVLKLAPERIGVQDNFFELGGHSLLATQLISKIRTRWDIELPLKAIFERPSVGQFAELIATAGKSDVPPILPVDRTKIEQLPLSFAQERLWFIHQLEPETIAYNLPLAVKLSGDVGVEQLEEAVTQIIARHENLRTVFPSADGQAQQRILETVEFKLEQEDVSGCGSEEQIEERTKAICQAEAEKPFDLANGPLLRGKVIRVREDEQILMLTMHHIVSDGWSVGVLLKELGQILEARKEGREAELTPLPIQYADYSVWQRRWLEEGGVLKRQLQYWEKKLGGVAETLDLATDYARPSVQSFAGGAHGFSLDRELTEELKQAAERAGCTLYMVLLAAFKALLYRYTGQSDICVGSPIANRQYGETEGLIGMFVNTLALRSQVEGEQKFNQLLAQVKATCLEAYEHQDTPFEKIVDLLQPERNLAISPIFQVMFILQNAVEEEEVRGFPRYRFGRGISKFDLITGFRETSEGLAGSIRYRTALYRPETIARMAGYFTAVCRAIVAAPSSRICDLEYIGEAERRHLIAGFNRTQADYPKDKCVHELFIEQVARHEKKTAVVCGNEQLTYRQLYERSLKLALYLQAQGVKPDSLIGLCMERSVEMMVGLLGILQAGGAYVPLDPSYPDERLAYMLEDSGAAIVLTQANLRERLSALLPDGAKLAAVDGQWKEIRSRAAALKAKRVLLRQRVQPHHLAYVIYTSGSTGRAKGVMVKHQSVVNLFFALKESVYAECGRSGLRVSVNGPITFDTSVKQIIQLLGGHVLEIVPEEVRRDGEALLRYVRDRKIEVLDCTPSQLRLLLEAGLVEETSERGEETLKLVLVGGEAIDQGLWETLAGSKVRFFNVYGPTECTVDATVCAITAESTPQTIGRPIANTQVYVLDRYSQPQPVGVPGELHVAGDGVSRGYLNRQELTQEKFVANPFRAGTRMYKTGDLARWQVDGTIQYLGRIDTQVKIRGFRIELGEIEAQLNQHEEIEESAVIAQGREAHQQLIAFYRAKGSSAGCVVEVNAEELRRHLGRTLPEYMVPVGYVSLGAIPLNANGKVDRKALGRLEVTIATGQEYVAPRNERERELVEIWAQVLKLEAEKIGVRDNFFELGGHSLLATQLISKIRTRMGVELPLKALFEGPTVRQLAELVGSGEDSEVPPILPVDRGQLERLPLSFAQERLWFIHQLEPETIAYNLPLAVKLSGDVEVEQLEEAVTRIIARHENLRTVFPSADGQAQQRILEEVEFKLEREDVSGCGSEEQIEERTKAICQAEAERPFDLANGPLLRGKVIRVREDEQILTLTMHHIVSDGWSVGVLLKELGQILDAKKEGLEADLAPLPIQYADYSVWQRRWLEEGGVLNRQLQYWEKKLGGVAETLDLATDYARPSVQSFAGGAHGFSLDRELTEELKQVAERAGCTLYMVLLAAFKALLYRYTGQSDICVGSPIANRQYGETEALIGMFVNTLALRSQMEGEEKFNQLLAQVKATCLEAYEHQDTPFEKIVDLLQPERNLAISPIFQVMFILQNAVEEEEVRGFPRYRFGRGISKFDLIAAFKETAEGLNASIRYRTALYRPETIARMAGHFTAVCRAIVLAPSSRICDLEYIGEAERRQLIAGFNRTQADYPKDKCVHELFIEQVARHEKKTAVVCGEEQLTYRQLYERSLKLALYLQAQGVKPDSLVGLCMERSVEMMVGLLGILQAGGVYVPLDPSYPDERLAYMLEDSGAAIVLTQATLRERLSALLPDGAKLVAVDGQWKEIRSRAAALKAKRVLLRQRVQPHHLAYVIYTSGSTGRAKGVMVKHQSVVNLFFALKESVYAGCAEDGLRVSVNGPITFDTSVKQIIQLLGGHVLEIVPEEVRRDGEALLRYVREHKIEVLDCTPSQLRLLLEAGLVEETSERGEETLKLVLVGGEAIDQGLWETLAGSKIRFFNVYGPTECTVDATVCAITNESTPQTIGRPIANTLVYVLDRYNQPQPVGVPGELHIAGDGVSRGYLNRQELTQEKFVANPFRAGTRMYKTGDLARWQADGTIQYLGRIDTQVKIRGFRIELGEIEAQLNQHEEIEESAVIAQGREAHQQLIAFYRAKGSSAGCVVEVSAEELRRHLGRTLPEYMVPAGFLSLAAIPLNANGKVDRKALAKLEVTIGTGQEYVAPRNERERELVEIWAQVLKLEAAKIGVRDNFFELGGHSLLATQLISKIRTRMGVELPLKALFEGPSVRQLAELVGSGEDSDVPPILPVNRGQIERLPLSFAQERLWFIHQLEPESIAYNLPLAVKLSGDVEVEQLEEAVTRIIARHENLRTVFPSADGQAQQRILETVEFKLEQEDVSGCGSEEEIEERTKAICQVEAETPFDLANGPLLRGKVIRVREDEQILMLTMHHIVSDGWSVGVLLKELGQILEARKEGREAELAPLSIQYVDYSVWQRRWLEEGGVLKRQLQYWEKKLGGVAETLDLATDYARPSVQSFAGGAHGFSLDRELTEEFKQVAERAGCTLYMVLLAAFKALLYRYTGQSDICVGSPIANRQYGETEGLIGMFVNTLALRSWVEGEERFGRLLAQVKATCLEAYEHQDTPFEKIVDLLQPERNLTISPIFQVAFVLQNTVEEEEVRGLPRYRFGRGISKFDLIAGFKETAEGFNASINYRTALYKQETIARMAGHFTALCRAIVATPGAKICDLHYISEAEKCQLLIGFNQTQVDLPKEKCLHEMFNDHVARNGNKTAVVCGEEQLTYRQLYDRSLKLALYLQSLGVKPDNIVGLCVERSLDLMVGMLGILQAGGAFVPLDANYPDERLAYMLQDSGAAIVLTQSSLQSKLAVLSPAGTRLIALDRQWAEIGNSVAALKAQKVRLKRQVRVRHLAYVIYTSGSTGQPKGVMVEHIGLNSVVAAHAATLNVNAESRCLQFSSCSFDACVFETVMALCLGGSLHLVQQREDLAGENLGRFVREQGITHATLTPAVLAALPDQVNLESVTTLLAVGEAVSSSLVKRWAVGRQMFNAYGPTEATIWSSVYRCNAGEEGNPPIGRPIANTRIYILDPWKRPVPVGVAGELYIGGAGVSRGYLNRRELTAERFLVDPFSPGSGARMYRTGDLGRWMDDGIIHYMGRVDTQVKIRGFRIELGEIETQLNQHPLIQDSAVIVQGQQAGKQLIAFYQAKHTTADCVAEVPYDELRAHLSRTLPEYMVPVAFVSLAAIPLNPSGKVDRRALGRMQVTIGSSQDYVAPRNHREKELVEIWAQVLKLEPEKIGIRDNFFELGGHSLLATQLISKIRSRMGVELPLKALFEGPSVDQLAELLGRTEGSEVPPIRPVDRAQMERLPLSFAQERLWFIHQLEPESIAYNLPLAVRLNTDVEVEKLEEAFTWIIARHENLRTAFPSADGEARQEILDAVEFKLEREDVSGCGSDEEAGNRAKAICQAEAERPFDLACGPLLRGKVIKVREGEQILMLTMHHIVGDGWSVGVLIRELGLILDAWREGRDAELAPLPIQYADYSVWQRRWLEEGGVLKRQLEYWEKKLGGVAESLDLATDYPRPSVQSFTGGTQVFTLDAQLTEQLKGLAEQAGGTLYMVLLAVFKVLLYRYTGQNDICVGSPIANRQYGETEALIGLFVNTLALRSQMEDEQTFAALLAQVKATCLEAYEHQDTPFEKIVDLLQPERNLAISPIFQVMFMLQNMDTGADDKRFPRYPLKGAVSKFDLTAGFNESEQGLSGWIRYSTALYKPETIARMAAHFTALCHAVTAEPGTRICNLDFLSGAEKQELLVGYNNTLAEYPRTKCIHQLFVEQVAINPDKTAVVFGESELTYRELYNKSRDLALYLQSLGVKPDSLVALCVERSLDMVVGLLGILQAGGAYVPLDPDYPDERLAHMLQDSQAAIVLTQEKLREKLNALVSPGAQLIAIDEDQLWAEIQNRVAQLKANKVRLRYQVKPHHLAYVIYTSGSTGKPKGVQVTHGSVVNLLCSMRQEPGITQNDTLLAVTTLCFDIAGLEIYLPLCSGARLVVATRETASDGTELLAKLGNCGATMLQATPVTWRLLLEAGWTGDPRLTMLCGGEALPRDLANQLSGTGSTLWNMYGPTETTIWSATTLVAPGEGPVFLGHPINNTQIYILDPNRRPQPIGVPGELYIAGDGLARGYLNRPELTQERFVENPFVPGARMYKTGDVVRRLNDGNIEFLGRNDHQVKIRGYRIELGEIEARLRKHDLVREAVVVAREDVPGEKRLVAYVVPADLSGVEANSANGDANELAGTLRTYLTGCLPEYMVPAAFVQLEKLPLTPNGKVDRKRLPKPELDAYATNAFAAPVGKMEEALASIWAEVLKIEKIGRHDNFFSMGGHSLLTLRLVNSLERKGINISALDIFKHSTIESLAAKVEFQSGQASRDKAICLRPGGQDRPLFLSHEGSGQLLYVPAIAPYVDADIPLYGLPARPPYEPQLHTVEEMGMRMVQMIREVQPSGPYRVAGWSFGGLLAYEVAVQLVAGGEQVDFIGLLDAYCITHPACSTPARQDEFDDCKELLTEIQMIMRHVPVSESQRLQAIAEIESAAATGGFDALAQKCHDMGILPSRWVDLSVVQLRQTLARIHSYRTAGTQYSAPGISVPVHVFRAQDDETSSPSLGWNNALPEDLINVVQVPGTHLTIMEKPNIQVLGQALADAIRNAPAVINPAAIPDYNNAGTMLHEFQ